MEKGAVIELPENGINLGVVLDVTRLNKTWYKACALSDNGDIVTCKVQPKGDNIHFSYKDVHRYNGEYLVTSLKDGNYVQSI